MRRIFNSLLGVWKCDETLPLVFDIFIFNGGNGYDARQSSLLYVFVRFFGLDRAQNLTKYNWCLRVFKQLTNINVSVT